MKKYIFCVSALIAIFPFCLHAQDLSKLDEKNGLKDFKLGDPYSLWKNYLSLTSENEVGTYQVKSYTYTGGCCSTIFARDVEAISLTFQNDTLFEILFVLSNPETNNNLIDEIAAIFGNPTEVKLKKDSLSIEAYWVTKKITLLVTFLDYSTIAFESNNNIDFVKLAELVGQKRVGVLIIDRQADQNLSKSDY